MQVPELSARGIRKDSKYVLFFFFFFFLSGFVFRNCGYRFVFLKETDAFYET